MAIIKIRCRACNRIVGRMIPTGKETHGLPEFRSELTHATVKTFRPFPNKEIEMKDTFCDYCEKPIY